MCLDRHVRKAKEITDAIITGGMDWMAYWDPLHNEVSGKLGNLLMMPFCFIDLETVQALKTTVKSLTLS